MFYRGEYNLLMTAFVLARLNGYSTTYFENVSIVNRIYLKPPFDAGNGWVLMMYEEEEE